MKCLSIFLLLNTISFSAIVGELKLVTGATEPMVPGTNDGYLNALFYEAFERIDVPVTITSLPPLRALAGANDGTFD